MTQIINEKKLDYDDVLIMPKRSEIESRKDVKLIRTFDFLHSKGRWAGIPIMASNMDSVGTIEAARVLESRTMFTCLHKFYSNEEILNSGLSKHYFAPSFGIRDKDIDKLDDLMYRGKDFIRYVNIDIANGYIEKFRKTIETIRNKYIDITIIAGNVCTPGMTEQLILSGADIVKVGIGPGQQCSTRIVTGVGYPQLSAVLECADAAHGLKGHIIADGGCKLPADVAKSFAAGADFSMLGSMLAGHEENTKEVENGNVKIYGMSSSDAMIKHYGKVEEHRAAEGRTSTIKYRGKIENTLNTITGGLRSTCSYVGAFNLKDIAKCTTFIMVNRTHNNQTL